MMRLCCPNWTLILADKSWEERVKILSKHYKRTYRSGNNFPITRTLPKKFWWPEEKAIPLDVRAIYRLTHIVNEYPHNVKKIKEHLAQIKRMSFTAPPWYGIPEQPIRLEDHHIALRIHSYASMVHGNEEITDFLKKLRKIRQLTKNIRGY